MIKIKLEEHICKMVGVWQFNLVWLNDLTKYIFWLYRCFIVEFYNFWKLEWRNILHWWHSNIAKVLSNWKKEKENYWLKFVFWNRQLYNRAWNPLQRKKEKSLRILRKNQARKMSTSLADAADPWAHSSTTIIATSSNHCIKPRRFMESLEPPLDPTAIERS